MCLFLLNEVAILRLTSHPDAIDAGPLCEVENPLFFGRLLAACIGRVECLRANAELALKRHQVLFQTVDVRQQLVQSYGFTSVAIMHLGRWRQIALEVGHNRR